MILPLGVKDLTEVRIVLKYRDTRQLVSTVAKRTGLILAEWMREIGWRR